MSQRTITVFTDVEDKNLVASFSELLEPDAVRRVATLEEAGRTASDLLILHMPKFNREDRVVPGELIDRLKGEKSPRDWIHRRTGVRGTRSADRCATWRHASRAATEDSHRAQQTPGRKTGRKASRH